MADNRRFVADAEKFRKLTTDKMLRVAKQSIQDTIRIAQTTGANGGKMPVDTSFLRNSLITELNGSEVGEGANSYVLGIAGMQLGDAFQVAWTAEYALARHYLVNANGGMWRDSAAQQWSRIVAANVRRVQ